MGYRLRASAVRHIQNDRPLMATAERRAPVRAVAATALDALSFEAPYVIERLVKDRIVDSHTEAGELFAEAKRYLVLCEVNPDADIGMYSVRVDEAWHAFLLYTDQYAQFCKEYFGRYIGHAPTNAPRVPAHGQRPELSFSEFRDRYEMLFDEPLPDVWYNSRGITATRRMFNDTAGKATAVQHDSTAQFVDEDGEVILSANRIALSALEFISRTNAFYVRELPGALTDDERITLAEALVSAGVLRPAP